MIVCFLDGQETPKVESFDRLTHGRGFFRFTIFHETPAGSRNEARFKAIGFRETRSLSLVAEWPEAYKVLELKPFGANTKVSLLCFLNRRSQVQILAGALVAFRHLCC